LTAYPPRLMRILFLSRWYPYPADNGSKLRVSALLRGLCERHEVTLVSFRGPGEDAVDPALYGGPPAERTHVCAFRDFEPGSRRAVAGYFSGTPRFLVDTHSEQMERLIQDALRRTRFDLVIASQLSMAAYYRCFKGIPAIFEEAELGVYRPDDEVRARWGGARRRLTWVKHARFMSRLLENFSLCTVASEVERRILAEAAPAYGAVKVVPNTVSGEIVPAASGGDPPRTTDSMIFAGAMTFAPNRDAMAWFVNDILPAVRAQVPGAMLTITGDPGSPPPFADPGVLMTGRVPDVRALVAASAVSVAPIRTGGGTRLKILEAMALRTPIVATARAVEGIDVRHGEHVLIAETPPAFAAAIEQVLRDPAGAREMAERACQLFRARYDSAVVVPQFLRLVDEAAAAA
jgi:polysaccharide biosynthesis protein PslH